MEFENPQDNEFNINPSDTGIDGDWAVIGRSGYVFHRNPDQTWNQVARLGAAESPVGTPLRMDGGRILIGGVRHDGNPVHVFDLSRVGQDCNCDGSPDSCDVVLYSVGDCQGNGIFDSCDIHDGTSSDCAGDYIPDECQPDCQSNGIEDSCDIAAGSQDCNLNARPDECELSYFDCNQNGRPDDCDTENETLIPNECSCIMTIAPEPEPSGWIKNRFISFVPGNPGHWKAIRVKLVTLHHVDPPYSGGPSIPFTAMEGEVRWVGPPFNYQESSTDSTQFYASKLQCSAEFRDWSTIDVLHVTSSAIVPSSSYEVQIVGANCNLSSSASYSPPLIIETGRWGDVRVPFAATDGSVQPDISDVSALVDKFRSVPGALSKARALLSSGVSTGGLNLVVDVGFDSISAVVDAFRGGPYPFTISSCP